MSQTRLRVLALALTGALTGGLYIFMNWQGELRDREGRAAAATARVFPFDPAAVIRLKLQNPAGAFVLERGEDGWRLVEPRALPADAETIPGMVRFLTGLRRIATVGEPREDATSPPTDHSLFELDPPRFEVTLETLTGRRTIRVGKKNAFDGNAYASVAGDDTVFTLDGGVHFQLDRDLRDLRDKRLVPLEPAQIVAFEGSGRQPNGTPWRLRAVRETAGFRTAPEAGEGELLDPRAVEEFLRRVCTAQVLLLLAESDAPEAIADVAPELAEPGAVWRFEGDGRGVLLRLRELADPKRYLVSSSALGIGELSSPVVHRRLLPEPTDLRDRRLFPWPRDAFDAVTLRRGAASVRLLNTDEGWTAVNEGRAETTRITALLYNLSRLRRVDREAPEGLDFGPALVVEARSGENRKEYELLTAETGPSWARTPGSTPFAFDGAEPGTLSALPSDYVESP